MPVQTYVDFSEVRPEHRAVDARLENWARWARGRGGAAACSPMFRLYRAPQHWRGHVEAGVSIDSADAVKVQKLVVALPQAHRSALAWCYIDRSNPRRAAQTLGETMTGLMLLIHDGRQMLVNRGA